ncbi:macro domain-containing protein [uncultured Sphingomonas sp.]|uniref:type II toxin-antitoxin system antitoxin DNA ADP-ribosyl glycohydrolase DarG n=1 Tax=uncultured Sphingomonas sp. TaxID=158754 RepID=UPI0025D48F2F|nr:macro domain-containing protein [uncultured Sphingomonas sp.]
MIEAKEGDILNAQVDALVNTVNCVGVMGRGIALQFKNAFPENFEAYAAACADELVNPGSMFIFETGELGFPKYIINFPTKRHWRGKSRIEDIELGLEALKADVVRLGIRSIAIPPLGSGLGGLNWSEVKPRIVEAFGGLPEVQVELFEPRGAPPAKEMAKPQAIPDMTLGRAALIVLIKRYLAGLMDPFVTLLELHKLLYFMQESGERLKLNYQQALYGPYAPNLSHLLRRIEGHFLTGYADGGDAPNKPIELVPGALADAEAFLTDPATKSNVERVAKLVDGFETPFGLELLATVHWVATRKGVSTVTDVVDATYDWNPRKRQFSQRQITIAYNHLREQGWLH